MAIPQGEIIPSNGGQFVKFQEGDNKVRILSDIITGWEGWKDRKPFRRPGTGDKCPIKESEVEIDKYNKPAINYFWAMVVWNYREKKVQVLSVTQKKVMEGMKGYEDSEDWGDLKNYDINIIRTNGDQVSYAVQGIPPKPLSEEITKALEESKVDLQAIFKGEYPIKSEMPAYPTGEDTGANQDVPF